MKLGNRKIVNLTADQVIKEMKTDSFSKEKIDFLKESVKVSRAFSRKDNKSDDI
ncbi:hypothetical protein [Cytobacillus kochii]|uniref:hypothetical protein n=1 Tax=Cytobacillus kochii TaxID=859143 RepID=UPI00203E23CF|nr:hypothetical protein [Cytobacillus kochii]MCM3323290.1 hypothetical protein [Cytobacillus kochii]MCM3345685.1 hypothetical protein [Cytobacillus kochii]